MGTFWGKKGTLVHLETGRKLVTALPCPFSSRLVPRADYLSVLHPGFRPPWNAWSDPGWVRGRKGAQLRPPSITLESSTGNVGECMYLCLVTT